MKWIGKAFSKKKRKGFQEQIDGPQVGGATGLDTSGDGCVFIGIHSYPR